MFRFWGRALTEPNRAQQALGEILNIAMQKKGHSGRMARKMHTIIHRIANESGSDQRTTEAGIIVLCRRLQRAHSQSKLG